MLDTELIRSQADKINKDLAVIFDNMQDLLIESDNSELRQIMKKIIDLIKTVNSLQEAVK